MPTKIKIKVGMARKNTKINVTNKSQTIQVGLLRARKIQRYIIATSATLSSDAFDLEKL